MFLALTPVLLIGCAGLVGSSPSTPSPTLDITNVSAISSAASTTQIRWTTNVAADSAVDYGTSTSYGTSTPVDPSMVTAHQVTIAGLSAATTYYYQVRSTDSKSNHGKSGDHSFKTPGLNISGTITPTAGGSSATLTLSGAASATIAANSSGAYTFAGLASGSYTITPNNTGYTFAPQSQTVSVSTSNVTGVNFTANAVSMAPTITNQPANLTIVAGQTATFSVTATGTAPLSYQWQKNGSNVAGATASSYTTAATTTADSGSKFDVVVSNSAGNVTSGAATLTVNAAAVAPTITTQPANQTVTAGQTATFTMTAIGTAPLGYQWQKNGTNISGATSSSYTTPATTTADTGSTFRAVVSNAAGTTTSNAATLTVNAGAVAPSITTQPTNQTVTAGQTATFTVTASGSAPLSYQWNKNGTAISGATSSTYTTPATTSSDNGAKFSVVVSNGAGSVTSATATLTVNATAVAPTIATQPVNQTVTAGQTATFTVTATGTAPLAYQWDKNGAAIPGATSSMYTTPATASSDNGAQFTVVVSNSAGSVTSVTATLTVNAAAAAPTIMTQPANQTVAAGQTATFNVTATGTAPLSYQWNKNGSSITGAIGPSYTTPVTTAADNNTTFDVIVSNPMGSVTSNAATLTIGSGTVCAPTGSGVCYYVSPAGSDSNPGTSAAPFLTIQHAANVVNPGDMVIVRDGTYNNPALSGVGSKLIVMSRGGTTANHVVFIAEHKWGAKIDGLNNTTATGWEFSANYIDVRDFDCGGFSDTCMENYNGGSASGGQFIDIAGNNIHDVGRYCATTTTGRDGIFIGNDNVIIEGNQIHDIGRYAPGENGCTNPAHYQNNDHGIYIDGAFTSANNLTIKNNIFYRNERGWSIQVYPAAVTNLRILNNTFLCGNPYRNGHITLAAPITNSAIENNISWQPTTGFLQYDNTSGYSNLSVANNLTYQGTVGAESAPGGVAVTANLDNIDPLLVSPPGCTVDDLSVPNAHLPIGSPAIDAGLTLADVPLDYAGTPRPQGIRFDIGAFEYIF